MNEDIKDTALPSYDRAAAESRIGFYSELKRIWDVADETCIHAIVEKYDPETHIATVRPLPVRVFDTKNGEVERVRDSVDVPVLNFCHGGFVVSSPIYVGDTGYLIAANKNAKTIEEKNGKILEDDVSEDDIKNATGRSDTFATKQFAWGFFIPCSWAKSKEAWNDGFQIRGVRDTDGYYKLTKDGFVEIFSAGKTLLLDNSGLHYDGDVELSSGNLTLKKGAVSISDDERNVLIDPKDLANSGARFREVIIVTGFKKKKDDKVYLSARRIRALVDLGKDEKDVEFEVGGEMPTVNDGILTINVEGETLLTFSANTAEHKTLNIQFPVKSVGQKANTFGIDVNPTSGNVRIENSGITGLAITQGSNRYLSITGGTDVLHGTTTVKTKDASVVMPTPIDIANTSHPTGHTFADVIDVSSSPTGSIQNKNVVDNKIIKLDLNKLQELITGDEWSDLETRVENGKIIIGFKELHTWTDVYPSFKEFSFGDPNNGGISVLFFASDDVHIEQRRIVAGLGINIQSDGERIIISATGSGAQTSGFTGTRKVLVDSDYDTSNHTLRRKYATETWENGLLQSSNEGAWEVYHQAVEENLT